MQIPNWPVAGDRELELLRGVLESPQWGGYHPVVAEFEKLFPLPDDTIVIPGHGGPTTIGREKERNPFLQNL